MVDALAPYFLNPAAAALGIGLLAVPIIIHLINRLRYRTVRFAAMEFLLASEQQNRRRVLIEQLLLLLLRLLIVALATLLIGRLVLSSSQLALFRGATLHHVVLLDDSLSTQSRDGRATAFDRGRDYIASLVRSAEAGRTRISVFRASAPADAVVGLNQRTIDGRLTTELDLLLGEIVASHQSPDWGDAIDRIADRIADDPDTLTQLHVVTDGRSRDWAGAEAVVPSLQRIEEAGSQIAFVRTTDDEGENLTLAALRPDSATAAVGVPMRLSVTASNGGSEVSQPAIAGVRVDGEDLPQKVEFAAIEPGESETRRVEVLFDSPGPHEVSVALPVDDLLGDNVRTIVLDVPIENPVLIVDSDADGGSAKFLADALGADRSLTGFAPTIVTPDALRRTPLESYQAVYLVDLGRLDSETSESLAAYVSGGGGLIWFTGEQARQLADQPLGPEGANLLPGRIQPPADLPDAGSEAADIVAGDHPIFRILGGSDNPFLDVVDVRRYSPIAGLDPDRVDTLATLRNGDPLVLEHRLGDGRIITVLTSAGSQPDQTGTVWNNWAGGPGAPSFAVFALELQQYVAARIESNAAAVGEPIVVSVPAAAYRPELEIVSPQGLVTGLAATPTEVDGEQVLQATYVQTDGPGAYRIELSPQSAAPGVTETRLTVRQIPPGEGQLELADRVSLERSLAGLDSITFPETDAIAAMGESDRGGLLRALVVALVLLLVGEQALAYRMGYHR